MSETVGAQPQAGDDRKSPSPTRTVQSFCEKYGLSPRECDVLEESLLGYSIEGMGKNLFISRETVKTHLRHIYQKTGCTSKSNLVDLTRAYLAGRD